MHVTSFLVPAFLIMFISSSKTVPLKLATDCDDTADFTNNIDEQTDSVRSRIRRQSFEKPECDRNKLTERSWLAKLFDWMRSDIGVIVIPVSIVVIVCWLIAMFVTFCSKQGDRCCAAIWSCCGFCPSRKREDDEDTDIPSSQERLPLNKQAPTPRKTSSLQQTQLSQQPPPETRPAPVQQKTKASPKQPNTDSRAPKPAKASSACCPIFSCCRKSSAEESPADDARNVHVESSPSESSTSEEFSSSSSTSIATVTFENG